MVDDRLVSIRCVVHCPELRNGVATDGGVPTDAALGGDVGVRHEQSAVPPPVAHAPIHGIVSVDQRFLARLARICWATRTRPVWVARLPVAHAPVPNRTRDVRGANRNVFIDHSSNKRCGA